MEIFLNYDTIGVFLLDNLKKILMMDCPFMDFKNLILRKDFQDFKGIKDLGDI